MNPFQVKHGDKGEVWSRLVLSIGETLKRDPPTEKSTKARLDKLLCDHESDELVVEGDSNDSSGKVRTTARKVVAQSGEMREHLNNLLDMKNNKSQRDKE